jgi:hypothetical protein
VIPSCYSELDIPIDHEFVYFLYQNFLYSTRGTLELAEMGQIMKSLHLVTL